MRKVLTVLGLLLLVGYGLFEARRLIEGPYVVIESPEDGSSTSDTAVHIRGRAENISFLTINDKPAYTDEGGHFSDLLSPPPGITVVTVKGTDRFGRETSKSISITILNYCKV